MYQIDHGIEVPPRKKFGGRESLYPFRDMNTGDSFLVEEEDAKRAKSAMYSFSHTHKGLKFSYRTMPDRSIRIWRVE